jgi:hypothetical protein
VATQRVPLALLKASELCYSYVMKREHLRTLEPTIEMQLPEVKTKADLRAALRSVMSSTFPGFVLRRAGLGEAITDNEELAGVIMVGLNALGHVFKYEKQNDKLQRPQEKGRLHQDAHAIKGPIDEFTLHMTNTGSGRAMIAHSGPVFANYKGLNPGQRYDLDEEIAAALGVVVLEGQTDPRLMQPELYIAELEAGDFTVFPLFNSYGPVWHRFDTYTPQRNAVIDVLKAA